MIRSLVFLSRQFRGFVIILVPDQRVKDTLGGRLGRICIENKHSTFYVEEIFLLAVRD